MTCQGTLQRLSAILQVSEQAETEGLWVKSGTHPKFHWTLPFHALSEYSFDVLNDQFPGWEGPSGGWWPSLVFCESGAHTPWQKTGRSVSSHRGTPKLPNGIH